eukprot:Nk52_evm12s243 gene=Nk52_evmTU12s243
MFPFLVAPIDQSFESMTLTKDYEFVPSTDVFVADSYELQMQNRNNEMGKKRSNKQSCTNCRSAHKGCSGVAPCERCVKLKRADTCVITAHRKRGPRKNASLKGIVKEKRIAECKRSFDGSSMGSSAGSPDLCLGRELNNSVVVKNDTEEAENANLLVTDLRNAVDGGTERYISPAELTDKCIFVRKTFEGELLARFVHKKEFQSFTKKITNLPDIKKIRDSIVSGKVSFALSNPLVRRHILAKLAEVSKDVISELDNYGSEIPIKQYDQGIGFNVSTGAPIPEINANFMEVDGANDSFLKMNRFDKLQDLENESVFKLIADETIINNIVAQVLMLSGKYVGVELFTDVVGADGFHTRARVKAQLKQDHSGVKGRFYPSEGADASHYSSFLLV